MTETHSLFHEHRFTYHDINIWFAYGKRRGLIINRAIWHFLGVIISKIILNHGVIHVHPVIKAQHRHTHLHSILNNEVFDPYQNDISLYYKLSIYRGYIWYESA